MESKGFFAVGLNKFMRTRPRATVQLGGEAGLCRRIYSILPGRIQTKFPPPIRQRRQKRVTFLSVTLEKRRT